MSHAAALMLAALAATPEYEGAGTASIPLSELVPLLKVHREAGPPVGALVSAAKLTARPRGEALEVTAALGVEVMQASWQRLALFKVTPALVPQEFPALGDAVLGVHDGEVCFFSARPGRHTLELKLLLFPLGARPPVAKLVRGSDLPPVAVELVTSGESEQVALADGAWTLRWQPRAEPAVKKVAPPPLEPQVASAHARFVTTLEGKGQLTVRYGLKLDRPQRFAVTLPEGHRLTRLTVNGAPRPLPEGQALEVEVAPQGAGDAQGWVELSLARELGVFHLSGRLPLELPAVAWPIAELEARAFLPAVFTWRRAGGSLEPAEVEGLAPVPGLPGRQLAFRQFLVSGTAPTLELEYAVDLEKRYFRARAPREAASPD